MEKRDNLYDVNSVGDWDDAGDGPAFYRDVIDCDQWGSLVDYAAMSSHNTHAEIDLRLRAAVLGVLRELD